MLVTDLRNADKECWKKDFLTYCRDFLTYRRKFINFKTAKKNKAKETKYSIIEPVWKI